MWTVTGVRRRSQGRFTSVASSHGTGRCAPCTCARTLRLIEISLPAAFVSLIFKETRLVHLYLTFMTRLLLKANLKVSLLGIVFARLLLS